MPTSRRTFVAKLLGAALLIALADWLFAFHEPGASLGLFGLGWAGTVAATRPESRRGPAALALAAAAGFALILVDDPNPLAALLFLIAIALAALLPRRRFDDALRWTARVLLFGVLALVQPFLDVQRLLRTRRRRRGTGAASLVAVLLLPVAGSIVFLFLFAQANPIIADAFARLSFSSLPSLVAHTVLWGVVLLASWSTLRPPPAATAVLDHAPSQAIGPAVPLGSLLLSLAAFNAIFAVQNALDVAFLWSGAPLPGSITMADYAHRGAYALIVTALLAGAFVLVLLRPGSPAAHSRTARRLVVLWVAQNLLLVASSALRTLDYVAAYSLTTLRVSALLWMLLVAVGLALVCWRFVTGRTLGWLVNANALALALVLSLCSVVDLGTVAARWNVAHARELGRGGPPLDLCYLNMLGDSALVPLAELERAAPDPALRERTAFVLAGTLRRTLREQAAWRSWSWRNARRLAAVRHRLGGTPLRAAALGHGRRCDGTPVPPPAAAAPAAAPLTREGRP